MRSSSQRAPVTADRCVAVARWLRVGVGVEDALVAGRPGPVAATADLVRVRLPHHVRPAVGCTAGMRWRAPSREPGEREVEGTPEHVHRARLADEPGAETGEHPIHGDQCQPEATHRVSVVTGVDAVVGERDRSGNLDGDRPDGGAHVEFVEHRHHRRVEVGDRHRFERQRAARAGDRGDVEAVIEEVEIDLERRARAVWHQRRRQPTRRDVQRGVPPVIDQRFVGESHLADDLGVQVQGVAGVEPVVERDRRPISCLVSGHRQPPFSSLAPCVGCRVYGDVRSSSAESSVSASTAPSMVWTSPSLSINTRAGWAGMLKRS